MIWGWRFEVWATLLGVWLAAGGVAWGDVPDGAACAAAGRAAEVAAGLPANVLLSVGLVESGRADPASGRIAAWPWTVNVDGAGRYFGSKADAVAFARLAQGSGAGDVDVGCFQMSLRYHPEAFTSLEEAFDPAANGRAAAAFLTRLRAADGSWAAAIAGYHSAAAALGLPYQRRVLATWRSLGALPAGLDAAGLGDGDESGTDFVVVREAPAARLVRVFTMDDAASPRAGLPRVVSP